jgi:YhcH/YjgK/YiaL family protein
MIVTALENLSHQMAMTPNMHKALEYLKSVKVAGLQPGQVEIDGKNVYVMIQAYETRPADAEVRLEAHRNYIDIQYVATGEEAMGWAHIAALQNPMAYNAEKDVWYGTLPAAGMTQVQVMPGQAAVFFPEDAHAPKLAVAAPVNVLKIVVKVRV